MLLARSAPAHPARAAPGAVVSGSSTVSFRQGGRPARPPVAPGGPAA
jgi:hypothetical protein